MFGWRWFYRRKCCSYEYLPRRKRRRGAPGLIIPLVLACVMLVLICFLPPWVIALVVFAGLALAAALWFC